MGVLFVIVCYHKHFILYCGGMLSIRCVLPLLLALLLVGESFQEGTLYLNEIQAIRDPITGVQQLPIECTLWEDNMVWLDNFNSLEGPGNLDGLGVDVEGALLNDGTWVFPGDFNVAGVVTIGGLLQVNDGFYTRNAAGDDFSFPLEPDTGNVFISGTLTVNRGINNQKNLTNPFGNFRVDPDTGLTTISGTLSPNAGINVGNGRATIEADGTIRTVDSFYARQDLILGTSLSEDRNLAPYTNGPGIVPTTGGDTTLLGQDAATFGGSIVLSPGFGTGATIDQRAGSILLGLNDRAHDLTINRFGPAAGNAGDFTFGGQTASGDGGDLIIAAGMPAGDNRGGDIVLNPGLASSFDGVAGFRGRFYLGSPADGANVPLYIQRPEITNSNSAGATFVSGQNSTSGTAGALTLLGGDCSSQGGSVYLEPGTSGNKQGKIIFRSGANGPTDLRLVREIDTGSDDLDAGATWFMGQTVTNGDGGDLILEAGEGSEVSNGDLYLSPGEAVGTVQSGTIFWGTNEGNPSLNIVRPETSDSPAHDTVFRGADSTGSSGGDLNLLGGDAAAPSGTFANGAGGDILILGGQGEEDYGGEVFIQAGSGNTGGDVTLTSGSVDGAAGDISFTAGGSGRDGNPGSIFLYVPDSDITFTASQVLLDAVPLFYDNNGSDDSDEFVITDGNGVTLNIRANANDPDRIFTLDDSGTVNDLLRDRFAFNAPFRATINPYRNTQAAAQDVFTTLQLLRQALEDHHHLIESN